MLKLCLTILLVTQCHGLYSAWFKEKCNMCGVEKKFAGWKKLEIISHVCPDPFIFPMFSCRAHVISANYRISLSLNQGCMLRILSASPSPSSRAVRLRYGVTLAVTPPWHLMVTSQRPGARLEHRAGLQEAERAAAGRKLGSDSTAPVSQVKGNLSVK